MALAGDTSTDELRLTLPARPASVAQARHAVSDYAEREGADAGAVSVAVSEMVTNAVLHAYKGDDRGEIGVEARRNEDAVVVEVEDEGAGISPNPDSPGLCYGLPLVAALSEELAIRTSGSGGTWIRMRFEAAG